MIQYGVVPMLAGFVCAMWEHDFFFFFKARPQCSSFCYKIYSQVTVCLVLPDRIEVKLDVDLCDSWLENI